MSQMQIIAYFWHSGGQIIPAEVKVWCTGPSYTPSFYSTGCSGLKGCIFNISIRNSQSILWNVSRDHRYAQKNIENVEYFQAEVDAAHNRKYSRFSLIPHCNIFCIFNHQQSETLWSGVQDECKTKPHFNAHWLRRLGVWLRKFDAKN